MRYTIFVLAFFGIFSFQVRADTSVRPLEPTQGAFGGIECGSEAKIFRTRAQRLREASAACRQDIAAGHPYCTVVPRWKESLQKLRFSPSEADSLAGKLEQLANSIDDVDAALAKSQEHYDVGQGNTTYHQPIIRCGKVGAIALPVWQRCMVGCIQKNAEEYGECVRGGIEEMGFCLWKIGAQIYGCKKNC